MLYKNRQEKELSDELFKNPPSEYRGAPFWAWNGELDQEELDRQISIFKKMGLGGFHMHVRTGLDEPYLEKEFMEHILGCIQTAEREGMLAWLYDEDRWPSGSAGGKVTKDRPQFSRKTLMITTEPYSGQQDGMARPGQGQESMRQENGELLAVYDIELDQGGCLSGARRIGKDEAAKGVKWYAYMEHASADPWFNNQSYVDTLCPQAIQEFIHITHETYKAYAEKSFGNTAPGIFTDEPQFAPKEALDFPGQKKDIFLPFTEQMPQLYRERYGEELMDVLPQLIWELPEGGLSRARWRFQNLVTDRFKESFCRQIGQWCRENGLLLTGHLMAEPSLESQTGAVGDAMRCYPEFGLPGIDMLCDFHEYTTAKQAQSMAHQMGAPGVLSELYGVTGWDYDFRGYKLQGDWQAALGVTLRVPHLSWLTMKGEAKRDYPASISYQSPWWDQFSMVEDHFARVNTALTRGKARVTVGVLHPIESYWMLWGPGSQTRGAREQMEEQFSGLCEYLLFGGIDFDYINEDYLSTQPESGSAALKVGEGEYRVVLVPPIRTIRSSTIERLAAFQRAGGRLVFLGGCPDYVDAEPSKGCEELYEKAVRTGFSREEVLAAVETERFLDIREAGGGRAHGLLYQLRQDGEREWLFICNGKNPESPDVDPAPRLSFTLKGEYSVALYDTMTGEISSLPVSYNGTDTVFSRVWHIHDSILLRLTPGRCSEEREEPQESYGLQSADGEADIILRPVDVRLSEPNMLLLDMAEYSLNGGEFYSLEEVLRIDNVARERLNIPSRRKEVCQPYLLPKEEYKDRLSLRFKIRSLVKICGAKLGIEEPQNAKISLNGLNVPNRPEGWFVDKAIETVRLPDIFAGESVLEISLPIGERTNLEAFYLLGDFGVQIEGCERVLTEPRRRLSFGDITGQGLPFYTGNLEYGFRVRGSGAFTVRVPQYRGGLIKVFLDGEDVGNIAYSPYTLRIDAEKGEHLVVLRLYGTRQNGFAQLHHTQGVYFYQSPNSWRSAGDLWSYEYKLKPQGILKSPEIYGADVLDAGGNVRRTGGAGLHMVDRS